MASALRFLSYKCQTSVNFFTVGVYCEWEPSVESIIAAGNGKVAQCFEEFKEDLSLKCSEDREYTKFTFTPMSDTPDLLYYQVKAESLC